MMVEAPRSRSATSSERAGFGTIGYSFTPDQKVSPCVLAGVGILVHQVKPATGNSESESQLGYTGAAGLVFNLNAKVSLWVEGRFTGSKDTKFIPIAAGVAINLGSSSM